MAAGLQLTLNPLPRRTSRAFPVTEPSPHTPDSSPLPASPLDIALPAVRAAGAGAASSAVIGAALVVLLGLTLTLSGMLWNRNRAVEEATLLLERQMDRLQSDVTKRFSQPVYGLKGARGAIAALDGRINRHTFRAYVLSRELLTEFPGVRGFGYAVRVRRAQLPAFVTDQRADEAPNFQVRTSGQADDLYVLAHVEPLAANLPAWGFDLGSEQVRRAAIDQAIRSGEATLSAPVPLVQDRRHGPGFVLLTPVFREGTDPGTPAEREAALVGVLYAPLVAEEILAGLKRDMADAPVDFRLNVANADGHDDLLLDSPTGIQPLGSPPASRPDFAGRLVAGERRWSLGGRAFRLEAAISAAYERRVIDPAGWGLGLLGSLLTLLLASTAYLLLAGRARAQALADAMTEDLRRLALDQDAMLNTNLVGIAKIHQRRIVWKNAVLERMFGYAPGELLDQPVRVLYPDAETFEGQGRLAYAVLARGGHYRTQLQMRRKDGSPVWIDLNGVSLPGARDEELTLWMMVDITQSKDYEHRVERAAFHDSLTGLPNRLLLADRLRQAIHAAGRLRQGVAVAYLDLDGFKAINDAHGHDAGDEVLVAVAQRLSDGVRATDTVARLGGDEFVVVMQPVTDLEDSRMVMQRLLEAVMLPIRLRNGVQVLVGSSVGVAHLGWDGQTANELMARADQAMFDSKRTGRCRIRLLKGASPAEDIDLSHLQPGMLQRGR